MRKLNYEKLVLDISNWMKEYTIAAQSKGIVVGLSGGIDSSVTAALSVKAFGTKNVLGVGMPCNSIPQDLMDAKLVAQELNIPFYDFDLTSVYRELLAQLHVKEEERDLALSNIKPRLRMTALYYLAQSKDYLVAGTGNRTEILIGYFTKHGDIGMQIGFQH